MALEPASAWVETNAKLQVSEQPLTDAKTETSTLGRIVKYTKTKISDLVGTENKATIKTFAISYTANTTVNRVRREDTIEQMGLFNSLNVKLQRFIIENHPSEIKIRYMENDPFKIQFIVRDNYKDEVYDSPTLLSSKADINTRKTVVIRD